MPPFPECSLRRSIRQLYFRPIYLFFTWQWNGVQRLSSRLNKFLFLLCLRNLVFSAFYCHFLIIAFYFITLSNHGNLFVTEQVFNMRPIFVSIKNWYIFLNSFLSFLSVCFNFLMSTLGTICFSWLGGSPTFRDLLPRLNRLVVVIWSHSSYSYGKRTVFTMLSWTKFGGKLEMECCHLRNL